MNQFISPYRIKALGVTSAHLEAKICDGPCTSFPLTVANGTGADAGLATLTTTAALPPGVYRLRLKAACGCFSELVYTFCPPPQSGSSSPAATAGSTGGGTHTGTGGTPTPIPSC